MIYALITYRLVDLFFKRSARVLQVRMTVFRRGEIQLSSSSVKARQLQAAFARRTLHASRPDKPIQVLAPEGPGRHLTADENRYGY